MINILKNKQINGVLAVCIAAVLWGLDGVVLTPRLGELNILLVVFVLHALPFSLMMILMSDKFKALKTFKFQDYLGFILIAFFGGFLGTYAIVKALFLVNFQHLTVVVLLQKLQPIFAIILATILLKEKIKKNFLLWASIAILAGYFLTFGFEKPNFNSGSNVGLAAIYSLIAAFSFGSSTVLSKKILSNFDFSTATFYRYGFTTLIMLILVLISGNISLISSIQAKHWLIFVIIGLTTGSGAIFLYYFGLTRVKAIVATICELCYPISAILFDFIFNGVVLSIIQWISAIIMLFAIFMLNNKSKENTIQN